VRERRTECGRKEGYVAQAIEGLSEGESSGEDGEDRMRRDTQSGGLEAGPGPQQAAETTAEMNPGVPGMIAAPGVPMDGGALGVAARVRRPGTGLDHQ
jgi:hypothetical protein